MRHIALLILNEEAAVLHAWGYAVCLNFPSAQVVSNRALKYLAWHLGREST